MNSGVPQQKRGKCTCYGFMWCASSVVCLRLCNKMIFFAVLGEDGEGRRTTNVLRCCREGGDVGYICYVCCISCACFIYMATLYVFFRA